MTTLEIARILQTTDINHDDAFKLAEAINGKSGLVTKEDLLKVENKLENKLAELQAQLNTKASKEDIIKLEAELQAQLNTKASKEDVVRLENQIGKLETSNKWIISIMLLFGSALVSGIVAILIKLYIS